MIHLLRVIHVGFGSFWAGSVIVLAFFLFPSVRAIGPAGGLMMDQLTRVRKLPQLLLGAGVLTVLSGLILYRIDSSGFGKEWMRSGPGMTFGVGGLAAIIAAGVAGAVNGPTAKRIGQLGAAIRAGGAPPTADQAAEMERLQKKMLGALRVVAFLLIVAVLAMAVARYVR